VNKEAYLYKIDYISKKFKDRDKERNDSIKAYLRDICIKKVKIKKIKINGDTMIEDNENGNNYIVMIVNFKENSEFIPVNKIYNKIYEYLKKDSEAGYIIKNLANKININEKYIEELLKDIFIDVCTEFLLAREYLSRSKEDNDESIGIKGIVMVYQKNENEYKIIDDLYLQVD
jgi:hypothetical protein